MAKANWRCVITPVARLGYDNLLEMVHRLIRYKLIHYEFQTTSYTAHPLVRSYYYSLLIQRKTNLEIVHTRIAEYYLSKAKDVLSFPSPSLNDVLPYIEVVHHKCAAEK